MIKGVDTILTSDPFPGPGPRTTYSQTSEADQGLPGPITLNLDENLWEALGKPEKLSVTIEAT